MSGITLSKRGDPIFGMMILRISALKISADNTEKSQTVGNPTRRFVKKELLKSSLSLRHFNEPEFTYAMPKRKTPLIYQFYHTVLVW